MLCPACCGLARARTVGELWQGSKLSNAIERTSSEGAAAAWLGVEVGVGVGVGVRGRGQSVAQRLPSILRREEATVRALLHHEGNELRPVGRGE